ncbi:MAG: carbohydrate kinase [Deltaproteobacteria bacterium]|jgi:fructokinase|nr:carbohydrate kinase [Deltaproteobacteria bacterium]
MILACGEALIDFISQKDSSGNILYEPCPGGSPFNTAVTIGRTGVPVGFLGRLSNDMFGDLLMDYINQNKIKPAFVLRSNEPTTLSFVKKRDDKTSEYAFYAQNSATWNIVKNDIPPRLSQKIKCFQFGSISMTMQPFADTVEDFIAREKDNIIISFDPNIRPGMIKNHQAYLEKFEKWSRCCSIIKMSDEDLEWLYPGSSLEDGLEKILNLGAVLAIVTCGEKGVIARNKKAAVAVPIYDLPLVDTVGAGDTFHGTLLAWLYRQGLMERSLLYQLSEEKLREAVQYAIKAAAINCSRRGADPPWADQMQD